MEQQRGFSVIDIDWRNEINELLADADFLNDSSYDWEERAKIMRFVVVPELINEVCKRMEDEDEDESEIDLSVLHNLVGNGSVGIAFVPMEKTGDPIDVYGVDVDGRYRSLRIVMDYSVWEAMSNGEAEDFYLNLFERAFLKAVIEHSKLTQNHVFVPYSEVLP